MGAMFAFLTPGTRDTADPVVSVKSAAAWLRQLPSLDLVARQQLVLRAFDGMRRARRPVDLPRAQALQYVDAALGADRRQLFRQYVESLESAPKVSDRIWHASLDLAQAFTTAYQDVLESALSPTGYSRWKPHVPVLFARLIHYYGTDAKLRVCRHERWIPAKWLELHRAYMRAGELGVDRVATSLGASGGNGTHWTVEQEYVYALLLQQLNSGNLSPANLDWAATQIRGWSRKLELVALPKTMEGFFVDLTGRAGLLRRTGQEAGAMLRYLDTTLLANQLDMTLAALRHSEETDQGPVGPINQQRAMILEKARAAIAPNLNTDMRRDPREPCSVGARVRIGLARIQHELSKPQDAAPTGDTTTGEEIEVYAVAGPARSRPRASDEADTLSSSLATFADPMWQVKDRSVAGLRICAGGGIGQTLMLGALVAVRQSDAAGWLLGVVRRLNKLSNDDVEAGVSLIAERVVAVTLYAKREVKQELGIVVNGLDASMMGPRFEGLYLPPPSRPDKPLVVKTLVVPTHEYAEGRKLILMTGRSMYTVALRQLVEQRADWSWAAIQIVEKQARGAASEM
jgi:cyclic-di-GMP-binding protein